MSEADNLSAIPERLAEPTIDPAAWVAPGAVIVGDVRLAARANVWYGCVLRGDITHVEVGEDSNIQDGCVLHIDFGMPCVIGRRVTVGHNAVIHGATVGDGCLVGMGATVLSGAAIGEGSIVAAGALVTEGMEVPPGTVVAGVPARVRCEVRPEDRARMEEGWKVYARLTELHRAAGGTGRTGGPGR